jgi:hypothetical protein
MDSNPIPDFVQLGYTWREAAFLYLVGRSSGFFLGRQYVRFLKRKPGALIQQLVEKASARRHIETLDYGQRRHIYHLKSRVLYRLLGDEDSQNRRTKGDQEIKTKLMILDYVLERWAEVFLSSPLEKAECLQHSFLIPNGILSQVTSRHGSGRESRRRPLEDRFPLFVVKPEKGTPSALQFTYFDHGTQTVKHFERHLQVNQPVLSCLGEFQMVYVGLSPRNFPAAERSFQQLFPGNELVSQLMPLGKKHLICYFRARDLWDQNDPDFNRTHLEVLKEGEHHYCLAEHEALRNAWQGGVFDSELARIGGETRTAGRLVFHLLRESYPVFGYRYRGKPAKPAAESQVGRFSVSYSDAN